MVTKRLRQCTITKRQMRKPDQRSAEARAYRKLYATPQWQAARKAQLSKQPLCERCQKQGRIVAASVVNHRTPHKGDWKLFIDPNNHESVCKPHHDGLIQREERNGGGEIGNAADGRPLAADHPWNR